MKQSFNHNKPQKDHKGIQYASITEMCQAYDIKLETYQRRVNVYHWSTEKALTTPVKKNGGQYCYDHEGKRYKSESLMCQHWGIERKTYKYRRSKGLSVEDSLTQSPSPGKELKNSNSPYTKAH